MVTLNWHNDNLNNHIGKSTCGKYHVEITNNGVSYDYVIIESETKVITKNSKPNDTVEEAKRVVLSLLSLKKMFI